MAGLAATLKSEARPRLQEILHHPFVRGMADGSLPQALFHRWLVQDYHYLHDYARAMAFAAARADCLSSMEFFAAALQLTLREELDGHRKLAATHGLDEAELSSAPVWPTARAYGDRLVRIAATAPPLELVAVLVPCAWSYLEVGRAVTGSSTYADWAALYTDPGFEEAERWLSTELSRLGVIAGETGRSAARAEFMTALSYELRFWQMCWKDEEPGPAG